MVPIWVSRFEKEINLLVTHDLDIIEFELENFERRTLPDVVFYFYRV